MCIVGGAGSRASSNRYKLCIVGGLAAVGEF